MASDTTSSGVKTTQSQSIQNLNQAKNARGPSSSTTSENSPKQDQPRTKSRSPKYSKESYPVQQRHVIESSIAGIGGWIQGPIQARADRRGDASLAAQYNRDVEIYAAASLGNGYTGTGRRIQAWEPSTAPWDQSQHDPDCTAQPYRMAQHWLDSMAQDQPYCSMGSPMPLDMNDTYGYQDRPDEGRNEDDWSVGYYESEH